MIYYVTLATIFFCGFFMKKGARKYLVFSLILLYVFSVLRDPYVNGTDGISYRKFFEFDVPLLAHFKEYMHGFEWGYALINSIAKTIYNDYFSFHVLYASISVVLLAIVVEKSGLEDNEKCLLLFTYFTFKYFRNAFEYMRQNIANEIIWIGFLTVTDSKKNNILSKMRTLLEYLWFYIAYLFHRSALFNLIIVPIVKKIRKIDKMKLTIGVAVISIICMGLSGPVINRLINIAISIGGERYEKYLIDGDTAVRGINIVNYLVRWFFVIMFLIQYRQLKYKKKDLIFAVSCIAIICGSMDAEIFTRMLDYYMIGIYIMMTLSCRGFKGKWFYIYMILFYICFQILLIRNLYNTSGATYLNYQLYPFEKIR